MLLAHSRAAPWAQEATRLAKADVGGGAGALGYTTEAGAKALQFITDFEVTHKVGSNGFMNRGQDAFAAGQAGMVLDGSFRISKFAKTEGLNLAISELPGHDGNRFHRPYVRTIQ